ncbi:hypothetical protein BGZ94_003804, partial [Podila epigama]
MTANKEQQKSLAMVRTQTMERARGNAIPIEFRTLSVHVTETQRSGMTSGNFFSRDSSKGKKQTQKKEADFATETDFFATIDYHKLTSAELALRFNTDPSLGLLPAEAHRRLHANGPNSLTARRPNHLRKILGYIFGGFCSV